MDLPSFRALLLGVNGNPLTDSLSYVFLYVTLVVPAILITGLTGNIIIALSIGILFFAVPPVLIGYTNKGLFFSQIIISVPIFFAFVILSLRNSGPPDYGEIFFQAMAIGFIIGTIGYLWGRGMALFQDRSTGDA
ncbi:hypothetical protein [Halomontanus rarus]|uniref:hypothetical protein n=1 Tax=Halomontanus rarus TaxID=3034020 RepID=UPI00293B9394|nr:hypothetical protein [Halovivax sp. KZCA124]